jgi:hypothetical protein
VFFEGDDNYNDGQPIDRLGVFWASDEAQSIAAPTSWTMETYDGKTWKTFEK